MRPTPTMSPVSFHHELRDMAALQQEISQQCTCWRRNSGTRPQDVCGKYHTYHWKTKLPISGRCWSNITGES
jgi:hypothetical protein